jgi:hypothetical protein
VAVAVSAAANLMERLGLSDEELCAILDVDPIAVITDELDHRPELPILLVLTAEAAEAAGPDGLRRWLRVSGPRGRPLDLLLSRDFAAFEDAVGELLQRGLVVRAPR